MLEYNALTASERVESLFLLPKQADPAGNLTYLTGIR